MSLLLNTRMDKHSSKVTGEYGKSFDFPKQHASSHVIDDIREKGTTNHHTTRPGEGFHQDVQQAYPQTNGKNEDPQLARIDENKEAVTLIRMRISNSDKAKMHSKEEQEVGESEDTEQEDTFSGGWDTGHVRGNHNHSSPSMPVPQLPVPRKLDGGARHSTLQHEVSRGTTLLEGTSYDVAMVTMLKRSAWKPNTV
ncbi:hypothetical protein C8J57DRAFT_1242108 [Mycena rebaudengoi]|nr:hypothetical protein C8J57DRAFT_1242108 [Mycena rebaudengoi]